MSHSSYGLSDQVPLRLAVPERIDLPRPASVSESLVKRVENLNSQAMQGVNALQAMLGVYRIDLQSALSAIPGPSSRQLYKAISFPRQSTPISSVRSRPILRWHARRHPPQVQSGQLLTGRSDARGHPPRVQSGQLLPKRSDPLTRYRRSVCLTTSRSI